MPVLPVLLPRIRHFRGKVHEKTTRFTRSRWNIASMVLSGFVLIVFLNGQIKLQFLDNLCCGRQGCVTHTCNTIEYECKYSLQI